MSIDERAAGQLQEDVLKRGSPHERGDRRERHLVHGGERCLAVIGVDDDAVRQHLDPITALGQTEALR
jgi:hypothetical protein